MKQILALFLMSSLCLGAALHADEASTECSKEMLLSYFPAPFVKETLKNHQVPQDKWDAIIKDLDANDKSVIKKVESRAEAMNPNPLKSREHREEAISIFRETLLEIFTETMNKNGITDKEEIQAMLDEVQHLKAKRFAECLEKMRKEFENNKHEDS